MKSTNDIKAFYRSATVDTNPAADGGVLADALQAGGLTIKKRAARAEPSVWRTIMKSRTTQLATAAVIIAAIVISLTQFSNNAVEAVEIGEIAAAMEQVAWMHLSTSGLNRALTGVGEQWIGFETKIHAGRWANGNVTFADAANHRQYEYDAQSNTLTITYMESYPLDLSSPTAILDGMQKMLEQQGGRMLARVGTYQGRKVQVQEMSLSNAGQGDGESHTITLFIDPGSKVLYAATVKGIDANGNVIADGTVTFDYPATGPQDIYDLGVPADAQVIDNTPEVSFQIMYEEYGRTRTNATNEYIAIVTHHNPRIDGIVTMIDVDFKLGRKQRQERHSVFHQGEVLDELWPTYREQLGETFAALLAWSRGQYDDPRAEIAIHLYDGEYYCSASRDGETDWSLREKDYTPDYNPAPLTSLGHLAWPVIVVTAQVIEDDYSRQNGLVCVESLGQGQVDPDGWASLPSRSLKYLDPSRDYLCMRQVTEWRPDAEWQQDKDWLAGVDPEKMRHGSIVVTEITEALQASNSHWYPETIVEKSTGQRADYQDAPLETRLIKRVYLDLSPEFPEGIFDLKELPGQ